MYYFIYYMLLFEEKSFENRKLSQEHGPQPQAFRILTIVYHSLYQPID